MRIVGQIIVGQGEADRYLNLCLSNLIQRQLVDDLVICLNLADPKTKRLAKKFSKNVYEDNREWGKFQPIMKQDMLERHTALLKPDWIIAFDADEIFDPRLDREKLEELASNPHDIAYYFWCVELWNDELHHREDYLFEDIRFFKYQPKFSTYKRQNMHGGIAPEVNYQFGTHSEYYFKHYGLLKLEDRQKKVERYKKYDPEGKSLWPGWYEGLLKNDNVKLFNHDEFIKLIPKMQIRKKPIPYTRENQPTNGNAEPKLYRFINPHGVLITVEKEKHYQEMKNRPGFKFLGVEPLLEVQKSRQEAPVIEAGGRSVSYGESHNLDQVGSTPAPATNEPDLKCKQCEFIGKTKHGLKVHVARTHRDEKTV